MQTWPHWIHQHAPLVQKDILASISTLSLMNVCIVAATSFNPLNATATLMSAFISKCHTAELPLTGWFACTLFICALWVYIAHVDSIFLKKVHFERGIAIKTCNVITFNTYTRLPWTHIFCPSIHSYLSFPYPKETGSNERTP